MSSILCPTCPLCGGEPDPGLKTITWPHQAFCRNEKCNVFNWDATQTTQWNLAHVTVHDMDEWGKS